MLLTHSRANGDKTSLVQIIDTMKEQLSSVNAEKTALQKQTAKDAQTESTLRNEIAIKETESRELMANKASLEHQGTPILVIILVLLLFIAMR